MTRIVFLGTPPAAVPSLNRLAERFDLALVVTQPDRPRGRSGTPVSPAVKVAADELGIAVSQPSTSSELEAVFHSQTFDLGVVVAYGRILKPEVLDSTDHGFLNVHFSLLPRWRGAAPVARAIMAGDSMTGVTIIRLDEGLDTGSVLTAQAVDIGEEETAGALTNRLADIGAHLVTSAVLSYLEGELRPVPQTDDGVTYADKIDKSDRPLDLDSTAVEAVQQVLGLAPSPGATLLIDGEQFKILIARPAQATPEKGTWEEHNGVPVARFADAGIELSFIQPSGKTPLAGTEWLKGARRKRGTIG